MSLSGAVMAALMPERISVIAGLLTFYLVITTLLTVRHRSRGFVWISFAAMAFALMLGLYSLASGIQGTLQTSGNVTGASPMEFAFGAVALLAAFGDLHMLLRRSISWSRRIARHLWRMCFALWIAAASFFLGQADEFPEALRIMPLLCTPVLLVLLLMFYWLGRVSFTQWRPSV
jgi:peptidoglycan/LPS O-acetylase OafA/YrhL